MVKSMRWAMLWGTLIVTVVWLSGCMSPLHQAVLDGNLAEVERLIKDGADINALARYDVTPLHNASEKGDKDIVKMLIAKGANVNAKNNNNDTPLLWARSKELAELLIDKGADVNSINDQGWSPLHKAAWSGNKVMVELLISKGADMNVKDVCCGRRPVDLAVKGGHAEVAKYLNDVMAGKVRIIIPAPPEDPKEVAVFEAEARKYRALSVKPALPEEARKYNVQAVAAFKAKKFDKAAEFYGSALKIAPWWPDGHFNRALILGELNHFAEAIREMKRYLQLVPDAPNARAAQDKIYEWEGELK